MKTEYVKSENTLYQKVIFGKHRFEIQYYFGCLIGIGYFNTVTIISLPFITITIETDN